MKSDPNCHRIIRTTIWHFWDICLGIRKSNIIQNWFIIIIELNDTLNWHKPHMELRHISSVGIASQTWYADARSGPEAHKITSLHEIVSLPTLHCQHTGPASPHRYPPRTTVCCWRTGWVCQTGMVQRPNRGQAWVSSTLSFDPTRRCSFSSLLLPVPWRRSASMKPSTVLLLALVACALLDSGDSSSEDSSDSSSQVSINSIFSFHSVFLAKCT